MGSTTTTMVLAANEGCWQWEFTDPQSNPVVRLSGMVTTSEATRLPAKINLAETSNSIPPLVTLNLSSHARRDSWLAGTLIVNGSDSPRIPVKGRWHSSADPGGPSTIWLTNDRVGAYLLMQQASTSSCKTSISP